MATQTPLALHRPAAPPGSPSPLGQAKEMQEAGEKLRVLAPGGLGSLGPAEGHRAVFPKEQPWTLLREVGTSHLGPLLRG